LFGLHDRGLLAPGARADVVVIDPETFGPGALEVRHDLPADAPRLHSRAVGLHHVAVNGIPVVEGHDLTGDLPGSVLTSPGRSTRGAGR
jgi:N-acyl-D-aspartate/D-glutamate deacylase